MTSILTRKSEEHGVHSCLNKSGVLVGPGFGVNNHTDDPGNLVMGRFLLIVTTYVEKPSDLVGPGLGVDNHTEAPGNLVIDFFLLNGQFSR
jgi:hypothetical protein